MSDQDEAPVRAALHVVAFVIAIQADDTGVKPSEAADALSRVKDKKIRGVHRPPLFDEVMLVMKAKFEGAGL